MSHWLDNHMLLVINYFVLTILITSKLVRGSGAVTDRRFESHSGHGCLVCVVLCLGSGLATG
jgi:hypothetical protein